MPYKSNNMNRTVFPDFLNTMELLGEGVEIGVWVGWHASLILDIWKGKLLYAVDPWLSKDQTKMDERYESAVNALAKHKDRCKIMEADSYSASRIIKDDTLDWVYIDGRHDLMGVTEDIVFWLPKLRKGGVMAGHDYENTMNPRWPEVKKAVDRQFKNVKTWPNAQTWYAMV